MQNWDRTIFLTLSILFPFVPTRMLQSLLTLTILKAQEKIKNFQNVFDEKINFTLKCSSQYKKIRETFQMFFMVRLTDFSLDGKELKF